MSKAKKQPAAVLEMPDTIRFVGNWKLMPKNTMAGLRTELMELTSGSGDDRKVIGALSMNISGACLYLETKEKRPDDSPLKAVYMLDLRPVITDAFEQIETLKKGV